MQKILSISLFVLVLAPIQYVNAIDYKPIVLDPNYSHNKWETLPRDIIKEFRAYTVSFDIRTIIYTDKLVLTIIFPI